MDDEAGQGRRTLAVIDGTLTQVALAIVLLVPTIAAVLLRPSLLAPQIDEPSEQGHRGVILAPGPFFAIGFLVALIGVSALSGLSGGAMVTLGADVFDATMEGQFWRAVSLVAPLFLAAIVLGLVFLVSATLCRLERRSLSACLRAGQYALFGLVAVMGVAEPFSTFVGSGGSNNVFEPGVGALIATWAFFFHLMALSGRSDTWIGRICAAALTAAVCGGVAFIMYGVS